VKEKVEKVGFLRDVNMIDIRLAVCRHVCQVRCKYTPKPLLDVEDLIQDAEWIALYLTTETYSNLKHWLQNGLVYTVQQGKTTKKKFHPEVQLSLEYKNAKGELVKHELPDLGNGKITQFQHKASNIPRMAKDVALGLGYTVWESRWDSLAEKKTSK
jgi:hypothetical protein